MDESTDITIDQNDGHAQYFSVSTAKLRNLYLLTFGFYAIYWFYKNWKLQQPYIKERIMPIPRAIFAIFFTHSLATRVKNSMQYKSLPDTNNLKHFATVFVVLTIAVNIVSRLTDSGTLPSYFNYLWLILFYLSALPLIEIQDKVNILMNDPLGSINSNYNWKNIAFMLVGAALWLMIILGILIITFDVPHS